MKNECPTCREFMLFPATHRCPPRFDCWLDWSPDSVKTIYADNYQRAAQDFAALSDRQSTEYPEQRRVLVREHGSASIPKKFDVTLESVPRYSAFEMPD